MPVGRLAYPQSERWRIGVFRARWTGHRSPLPLRFGKTEWKRMDADAERWGWAWALASVDAEGAVTVLDPAKARHGRKVRIDAMAEIDNLLRWLDGR